MNKHKIERAHLLHLAKAGISNGRRSAGPINKRDYVAVYTPPANNPMHFGGPCLIWRHSLDADGYGVLRLRRGNRSYRANRVAYKMSRGEIPEDKLILHMCHRRSCIQPAHLYAGSHKQNIEDRQDRLSEERRWVFTIKQMDEYSTRLHDGMKYYWDEPPEVEPTLFQQQTGKHRCEYTIPAGEHWTPDGGIQPTKLCQICFESNSEWPGRFGNTDPQKEETMYRAQYRRSLEKFFEERGPSDSPLNIVPG